MPEGVCAAKFGDSTTEVAAFIPLVSRGLSQAERGEQTASADKLRCLRSALAAVPESMKVSVKLTGIDETTWQDYRITGYRDVQGVLWSFDLGPLYA